MCSILYIYELLVSIITQIGLRDSNGIRTHNHLVSTRTLCKPNPVCLNGCVFVFETRTWHDNNIQSTQIVDQIGNQIDIYIYIDRWIDRQIYIYI